MAAPDTQVKCQTRKPVRSSDEVKAVLRDFAPLKGLGLPSMPHNPIVVIEEVGRPRPLIDGNYEGGMAVCVGGCAGSNHSLTTCYRNAASTP